MRKLLIAVIILAGLLVAADRVGAVVASREIASRVQAAYDLPSKPSVTRVSVASGSSSLSSVIAGQFRFVVPVTGLPLHLAVRSVSVVPGGVRVSVSAADVTFAGRT